MGAERTLAGQHQLTNSPSSIRNKWRQGVKLRASVRRANKQLYSLFSTVSINSILYAFFRQKRL